MTDDERAKALTEPLKLCAFSFKKLGPKGLHALVRALTPNQPPPDPKELDDEALSEFMEDASDYWAENDVQHHNEMSPEDALEREKQELEDEGHE